VPESGSIISGDFVLDLGALENLQGGVIRRLQLHRNVSRSFCGEDKAIWTRRRRIDGNPVVRSLTEENRFFQWTTSVLAWRECRSERDGLSVYSIPYRPNMPPTPRQFVQRSRVRRIPNENLAAVASAGRDHSTVG
jgi:hypothetical protein